MRWIDWLALLLIVSGAVIIEAMQGDTPHKPENPRRPSPHHFEDRAAVIPPSPRFLETPDSRRGSIPFLGQASIEAREPNGPWTGSAVSISDDGIWLTARHVAEGCNNLSVAMGATAPPVGKVTLHPNADIAIMITGRGARALPIAPSANPPETSYNIGFPAGRPGAVNADFLGEMMVWHKGRNGYREQVHAWAERTRFPPRKGSLGGLSGGAVLDARGRIIGVVQSEEPRRGRVMTAKPQRISEIISQAAIVVPDNASSAVTFDRKAFGPTAYDLLRSLQIAKVYCRG